MIDKLSFLKGADGGGASADEERLMQLFQNRAGLKKAYADLKDEFHLLRDRLKQQEGATIRVQEQLDALGDLLADPRTGFGALVFFQLRGLWKTCHQQLSRSPPISRASRRRARPPSTRPSARPRRMRASPMSTSGCRPRRPRPISSAAQLAAAQDELLRLTRILALLQAPPAAQVARDGAPGRGGRGRRGRRSARGAQRDQQRGLRRNFPASR